MSAGFEFESAGDTLIFEVKEGLVLVKAGQPLSLISSALYRKYDLLPVDLELYLHKTRPEGGH